MCLDSVDLLEKDIAERNSLEHAQEVNQIITKQVVAHLLTSRLYFYLS